jgi:hypothetical protein
MIKNKKNKKNKLFKRFFAYWIFTYGVMRISNNNLLILYSYFIEAIFFINEYINHSVDQKKTLFVITSSLLLGNLSYFYK